MISLIGLDFYFFTFAFVLLGLTIFIITLDILKDYITLISIISAILFWVLIGIALSL